MGIISAKVLLPWIWFALIVFASAQGPSPDSGKGRTIRDLQEMVTENGGCKVNLCFALEGSRSISGEEFKAQKRIVRDIARVISADKNARLAAVQYGVSNIPISPITDESEDFLKKLNNSRRAGAEKTFIGAGILYCADQIRAFPEDANSMVLLGEGRNSLGADPIDRADTFRELGGEVFAIAVGDADVEALKLIVGKSADNLLILDENDNGKSEIAVVSDLVRAVCGIKNTLPGSTSDLSL